MLSSLSTAAQSSESTYLKCNNQYYKLAGSSLESNYNIRAKKFISKPKIYSYKVVFINFGHDEKINRNTGEWKDGFRDRVCILKKINQEGKLF